jgi:hypothetical protein
LQLIPHPENCLCISYSQIRFVQRLARAAAAKGTNFAVRAQDACLSDLLYTPHGWLHHGARVSQAERDAPPPVYPRRRPAGPMRRDRQPWRANARGGSSRCTGSSPALFHCEHGFHAGVDEDLWYFSYGLTLHMAEVHLVDFLPSGNRSSIAIASSLISRVTPQSPSCDPESAQICRTLAAVGHPYIISAGCAGVWQLF